MSDIEKAALKEIAEEDFKAAVSDFEFSRVLRMKEPVDDLTRNSAEGDRRKWT